MLHVNNLEHQLSWEFSEFKNVSILIKLIS